MEGSLTPSLPRTSELLPALTQPSAPASRGPLCTLGCCTLASSCLRMLGRLGLTWVLPHVSRSYLKRQTMDLIDANIFTMKHVFAFCCITHSFLQTTTGVGGQKHKPAKSGKHHIRALSCCPRQSQDQSAVCSATDVLQLREGENAAPRAATGLRMLWACKETPCTEELTELTFPESEGKGMHQAHQHSFM